MSAVPLQSAGRTHPESGAAIPIHRLDHCLNAHVVADQVLVAREQHDRDALQHTRQHRDRGVRGLGSEVHMNLATTFRPLVDRGCGMNRADNVLALSTR